MKNSLKALAFGLLMTVLSPVAASAQDNIDPFIGTWIFNPAKSNSETGLPKAGTRTFDYTGDGMILSTRTGVNADGTRSGGHWIATMDGKEYVEYQRTTSGPPNTQIVLFRRVDAYTLLLAAKREGKLGVTGSFTVSKDGKTLTQSVLGIDLQGRRYKWDQVYDKQ
jgi:hypothetical protein